VRVGTIRKGAPPPDQAEQIGGPPSTRPLSRRAADIVATARILLEKEGVDALTMRRLAGELGIRAPSLYKHLPGKEAIRVALIEVAFSEIGAALHASLAQQDPARVIPSLLATYRRLGTAQPNLYRLATTGVLPRAHLTPGLEEWAGRPFVLATGDPHLAQALWSFAHGMVILEIDGRYPEDSDLDRTWAAGAAAFGETGTPPPRTPVTAS